MVNVVKTLQFLPPKTGNGKHSTYKNGDDWEMVYDIVLSTLNKYILAHDVDMKVAWKWLANICWHIILYIYV